MIRDVRFRQNTNDGSMICLADEQTIALQYLERFTHRHSRDSQAFRDLFLRDFSAGGKTAVEDLRSQNGSSAVA